MNQLKTIFLSLFVVLTLSSCATKHQKLLKSTDYDAKYEAALLAYNQKRFSDATQLFESLLLFYRGPGKAETVHLYYAKSLMETRDYYSAGYQFQSFGKLFPYSSSLEEALYFSAYCKAKESPDYSLDQTLTRESLQDCELFVQKYPQSERIAEVKAMMESHRSKLMKKAYENAYAYYKIESYQAAQVSLKQFLKDYPNSPYSESAMYYTVKAGFILASNSVERKKQERYAQARADYQVYYPLLNNEKYQTDLKQIANRANQ